MRPLPVIQPPAGGAARAAWDDALRFRCTECGDCCRGSLCVVTDADVRRVSAGTGQDPVSFLRFVSPQEALTVPPGPWWIDLAEGPRVLALRQWGADAACLFLKDDRCTVHAHRPRTCRAFPWNLDFDEDGRRLVGLEIGTTKEVCPYELDGANDPAAILENAAAEDREDDAFFALVQRWNQDHAKGSSAAFLRFLDARGASPETGSER